MVRLANRLCFKFFVFFVSFGFLCQMPVVTASSFSPDMIGAGEAFQADGTPDAKVYVRVSLNNAR